MFCFIYPPLDFLWFHFLLCLNNGDYYIQVGFLLFSFDRMNDRLSYTDIVKL